jgi:thymidylate synthase (FAD)
MSLLRDDATRNYDHYLEMLNEDEAGQPLDPARQGWRGSSRG